MITAGLKTSRLTVDGSDYVLALGTGERSYGRDGGDCAFVYDAEDFDGAASTTYIDLCDELLPVGDYSELRRIAIAAAARLEARVTIAWVCEPVLSDDEYALVRDAVAAVQ